MWSSDSDDENAIVIVRRRRIFRTRINYRQMDGTYQYNERFKLTSEKMEDLIDILGHSLHRETHRNQALSVKEVLQAALHWLGTGGQYQSVADMHGISKASVSRAVHAVVATVNTTMLPQWVRWPHNMSEVVGQFYCLGGMPLVCGCIDGTLVKIDAPSENEHAFIDQNGDHSINVMLVCGPDLQFYYVNANWPGSVHDARVLRNSAMYFRMEKGWRPIENAIILGDSAYPLRDWLVPPVSRNPSDATEQQFLRAHRGTRRVIKSAIRVLKEKFLCLNFLRVTPDFACEIVKCCATLCNYSRSVDDIMDLYEARNDDGDGDDFTEENEEPLHREGELRLQEIQHHFKSI